MGTLPWIIARKLNLHKMLVSVDRLPIVAACKTPNVVLNAVFVGWIALNADNANQWEVSEDPAHLLPHQPSGVEYAWWSAFPTGRCLSTRSTTSSVVRRTAIGERYNDSWRVSAGCCIRGTRGGSRYGCHRHRGRRLHDGDRRRFCCGCHRHRERLLHGGNTRRFCYRTPSAPGTNCHNFLQRAFLPGPVVCNLEPFATVWTAKLNHGLSLQDGLRVTHMLTITPARNPG